MAPPDLEPIGRHRSAMAALRTERAGVLADLEAGAAVLDGLVRAGAPAGEVAREAARVRALEARRRELHDRRVDLAGQIAAAAGELADADADPATAVESLDGRVPVALLPVRIETRFADGHRTLHIRVFPDQVHLDAHEPGLTDDERAAGEWYWQERWPALDDAARAEAAWRTVTARLQAGRARYVVDLLRPGNAAGAAAEPPVFPDTERRAGSWTRAVEASALPERWVAIGFQESLEVFRVWSSRVPDRLAAGPSPDIDETPPPADPDARTPRVQDAFRWAVDPEAARAAGMLVTVRDADLAFNRRLAAGLTRLLVIGVDWTLTPEQAAAAIEGLLAGHAASGDLAFVAPGTPTNNTGTDRSGFSTAPASRIADWAPPVTGADPDASPGTSAGRLAAALGIDPAALASAPGAGGRFHRIESALVDALWEATGGYYATEMLEPHGSDRLTAEVRAHAAASLHAAGPLPTIRVGPQPYGVLPVSSRRLASGPGHRSELMIHRMSGLVRQVVEPTIERVPRLGRADETRDVDDVLLDLLQRTPVPWHLRWRELVSPPQWTATEWLSQLRARQAPWLAEIAGRLDVPPDRPTRLQYLTAAEDSHPLAVPLVATGDDGTAYLAEIAALVRGGSDGRRALNLRQDAVTLLEALLAFAAVQELDKAASGELVAGLSAEGRAAAGLDRLGVRTPDLVRVEEPDAARLPLAFASARVLAEATVPGSGVRVHDQLARRLRERDLRELAGDRDDTAQGLGRFLAALDELAGASTDELSWAFRGVLDLFASRLDAWITSLATARLAEHRAARPVGLHLGCYGWVEDLRPDEGAGADSLGHVTAPSLDHAVAAAVLRSGRQAHQDAGAFDLDLSSARVREALRLLEGVAAGQPIAALVGYRLERSLRDGGLAELIVPFRLLAPLQARAPGLDGPVESVAARDVVDGVRLLALAASGGWEATIAGLGVAGARRDRLAAVIADVAGAYDAVADVLVAESVHQAAAGNLDRASAAAAALDRQERPVPPDVVRTPRDGAVVTSRVVVALPGASPAAAAPAAAWPARGVRGSVEPRLDTWLGGLLGDPATLVCGGRLVRGDVATDLGEVSALDVGLSPLALVLAASRPAADQPTELESRIAGALAARVASPDGDDRVELDGSAPLLTLAGWASHLVSGARSLQPADLALAGATPSGSSVGTVDLDELRGRLDDALATVRATRTSVASSARTPAGLRAALLDASELLGVDALPAARPGAPDEAARLGAQADEVVAMLDDRLARAAELRARPLGAGQTAATRLADLAAVALGAHQPVLPVVRLGDGAELAASAVDRVSLLSGDPTSAITWLHRAGFVRPELGPLCGLLTHAEAGGADVPAQLTVAQLPHRPGAPWCELPHGEHGPPPAGTTGVVAVAPMGFDPTRPLVGLFVDAWAEVIPSSEHTAGVAFHYDAPGARPPQAILLAVHPDTEPERWSLDHLVETVQEVIALSRLRTLTLRETEDVAGFFPALFLPDNYTRDVPSVSFKGLVRAARAAQLAAPDTGIRGKP